MSGVPSANTRRAPMMSFSPLSFAAICARTTPATELRSATPSAARPSTCACSTNSSGCDAPRRKEKLVVTASSAYADIDSTHPPKNSPKQTVQEPARVLHLAAKQTFAVEPDARAGAALDAEIIACERAAGFVAPPLHGDALGPFHLCDFVQNLPPAEPHRRALRHFGHFLDQFRPRKQPDGSRGSEGVLDGAACCSLFE